MYVGGPSEDTLQQVLPLVLERLEPEWAVQLFQVRKPAPSLPPFLDAPLPSLPPTARPVHVLCWTDYLTRESHERCLISLRWGKLYQCSSPQCLSLAASHGAHALNLWKFWG